MKRCPITYEVISDEENYSQRGLRLLSPKLRNLKELEKNATELRKAAITYVGKMSIQGMQAKLSARLNLKEECFEIVDQDGRYILKPQSDSYPELPENEAITMTLAEAVGIEIPVHGLVYSQDKSMAYFIKRFDRVGHRDKLIVEDFAQLGGFDRDTKYDSSMEKVINIVSKFCTFPKIEFIKLFKLTLFNFLIGNEDMHLKNFSLVSKDNKIMLSPAYDLLNTTIAQENAKEEMALPLNGKKQNLKKKDFLEYFPDERLGLNLNIKKEILTEFQKAIPLWLDLIKVSFLSDQMKIKYLILLEERCKRLGFIF